MKVYISVDMEGITGAAHWDDVIHGKHGYSQIQKQMTAEVRAACEGCNRAGAKDIVVKDAHNTGRNILIDELPKNVRVIRGWSGHPYSMVQEIDDSFSCMLTIGYHSRASSGFNPLSHTFSSGKVKSIEINKRPASEFLINGLTAAFHSVPVVFASGDEGLCQEIRKINPNIETVAVLKGVGDSTISINPNQTILKIEKGVEKALKGDIKSCILELPDNFTVDICFKLHPHAYKDSFYPGAKLINSNTIRMETDNYLEVLKFFTFTI
jgi:D-amino peptidase